MVNVKQLVQKHREQVVGIRRELHQIPEPAYTEKKTSARVADHLKAADLDVRTGIAKFGVVGLLATGKARAHSHDPGGHGCPSGDGNRQAFLFHPLTQAPCTPAATMRTWPWSSAQRLYSAK